MTRRSFTRLEKPAISLQVSLFYPLPVEVIRQKLYGLAIFRPTRRDNCGKVLLVIKQMIGLSKHQAQHPDRPTGTLVLGFVDDGFSGGDETAFFHYTAAGRVVYKMPGYKGFDIGPAPDMLDHQLQRFRAKTLVPIRLGDPVSD